LCLHRREQRGEEEKSFVDLERGCHCN
jgi:hypothetical protein